MHNTASKRNYHIRGGDWYSFTADIPLYKYSCTRELCTIVSVTEMEELGRKYIIMGVWFRIEILRLLWLLDI